jgi:hypothetical protein
MIAVALRADPLPGSGTALADSRHPGAARKIVVARIC